MHRVGVDLVETARIGRALARYGDRFLQRVYTPAEIAYCRGRVQSLAARWAAKEAVSKALGLGIGFIRWRDIEVRNDVRGAPFLELHGQAEAVARELGLKDWAISLTHTAEQAVAFVVAM
jgi:holo-[acyl-carrier protein] synthase